MTYTATNNFLVSLSNFYNLDEPIEILDFIGNQKPLMSLLTEAPSKIKKFFPSCKLNLKVLVDAEIPSWQELAIIIITDLNPDEAFDSLKQLDYSWWLEASASVNLVNIHVEFE